MDEGVLEVGGGHRVFYQVQGELQAQAVLFVHGGPGAGVQAKDRLLFEDHAGAVVFVDQRAAGRSTCDDARRDNTTSHLIADFEQLRRRLNVQKWVLVGGSWGSTLSLAYAVAHRHSIARMILHGIFLLRQDELDWFYKGGAAHLLPDEYQRYLATLEPRDRHNPLSAFHRLLFDHDERTRHRAAEAWSRWEAVNSFLEPTEDQIRQMTNPKLAVPMAQMETHYFVNGGFFGEDNYLLNHADAIKQIPTTIIHGRYDMICPMKSAWDLHQALPESELHICSQASHDASEPQINAALRHALAQL